MIDHRKTSASVDLPFYHGQSYPWVKVQSPASERVHKYDKT